MKKVTPDVTFRNFSACFIHVFSLCLRVSLFRATQAPGAFRFKAVLCWAQASTDGRPLAHQSMIEGYEQRALSLMLEKPRGMLPDVSFAFPWEGI